MKPSRTPEHLKKFKLVDEIIPEPTGGAHNDPEAIAETLKNKLLKDLKEIQKMPLKKIQADRYKKFRAHGKFSEKELIKTQN